MKSSPASARMRAICSRWRTDLQQRKNCAIRLTEARLPRLSILYANDSRPSETGQSAVVLFICQSMVISIAPVAVVISQMPPVVVFGTSTLPTLPVEAKLSHETSRSRAAPVVTPNVSSI